MSKPIEQPENKKSKIVGVPFKYFCGCIKVFELDLSIDTYLKENLFKCWYHDTNLIDIPLNNSDKQVFYFEHKKKKEYRVYNVEKDQFNYITLVDDTSFTLTTPEEVIETRKRSYPLVDEKGVSFIKFDCYKVNEVILNNFTPKFKDYLALGLLQSQDFDPLSWPADSAKPNYSNDPIYTDDHVSISECKVDVGDLYYLQPYDMDGRPENYKTEWKVISKKKDRMKTSKDPNWTDIYILRLEYIQDIYSK